MARYSEEARLFELRDIVWCSLANKYCDRYKERIQALEQQMESTSHTIDNVLMSAASPRVSSTQGAHEDSKVTTQGQVTTSTGYHHSKVSLSSSLCRVILSPVVNCQLSTRANCFLARSLHSFYSVTCSSRTLWIYDQNHILFRIIQDAVSKLSFLCLKFIAKGLFI